MRWHPHGYGGRRRWPGFSAYARVMKKAEKDAEDQRIRDEADRERARASAMAKLTDEDRKALGLQER